MKHLRHRWYNAILGWTLLALGFHYQPLVAQAQVATEPTLHITGVDRRAYPLLTVTVAGDDWPVPLADLPLTVNVDGQELPLLADESIQQGLQLAIAIDVNQLFARGQSGQSGYIEMVGTVRSLVENAVVRRDQDWLAAYLLQGASDPQPVQAWTQDPDALFTSIVTNRPTTAEATPLATTTVSALLRQFTPIPDGVTRPKTLLLFTSGALLSDLEKLIAEAQEAGVTVHVVALLGDQAKAAVDGLQQLATATGGQTIVLASPEMITPLVEALTQARGARRLQVRADQPMPQALTVTVTRPDGKAVTAQITGAALASVAAVPMAITLTAPITTTLNWNALTPVPANPQLHTLPVGATFAWPAGAARQLVQVTYTLRGPGDLATQAIRTAAPFDQATLTLPAPLTMTAQGYTLEVMALDELGIEATHTAQLTFVAAPVQAAVAAAPAATQANQPAAAPTIATPAFQPTESVTVPGLDLPLSRTLLIWLLPILLGLIAFLIYSERRDRRRREAADHPRPRQGQSRPATGVFALKEEAQRRAQSQFQLKPSTKGKVDTYLMEGRPLREEAPLHRGAPGPAVRSASSPAEQPAATPRRAAPDAAARHREELAWPHSEEATRAEEFAPTVAEEEDEDENTYRTQELARPIIGYLLRATSDPNLPKELPIYGLNPGPGQLRQIHIGRHSKHNTVVINDKSISREHAVIVQREGGLYLRDNGSTAGTFLNWKRLNAGDELLLRNNDLIGFGAIAYEFRAFGEDEATIASE